MDIPIDDGAVAGQGLTIRTARFFKGPTLLLNGVEQRGRGSTFQVRNSAGRDIEVRLTPNGLDPVPKVALDGRTIQVVRPLTWIEWGWMALPIVLVFTGGALGGAVGVLGVYSSAHIFRSQYSTPAKFGLSALVSLGAVVAFSVGAALVQWLIRGVE